MKRWLILFLLCAATLSASAQESGETVIVSQPVNDDFYGAGRRVDIRAQVSGDAVVAGQLINVTAPVAQDLIAAGGSVVIGAPVGDDVRVAGGDVRIESNVAGHLVAAGGGVTLLSGTRVGSFAWLFGRDIELGGDVEGDLKAGGETVRIAGHIKGSADIRANRLELLPGARIDGDLKWSGAEKQFDQGATIGGRVIEVPRPEQKRGEGAKVAVWASAIFILAYVVVGVVLYLLFPRVAEAAAATVRRAPWAALGIGFAALILTPFLIILLFVTAVGWLLALILLALYLMLLPIGGITGTYALLAMLTTKWYARLSGRVARLLLFALAIIVVGLLHFIPIIGWLIGLWLMLWGIGALLITAYHSAGRATEARPTS